MLHAGRCLVLRVDGVDHRGPPVLQLLVLLDHGAARAAEGLEKVAAAARFHPGLLANLATLYADEAVEEEIVSVSLRRP